MLSPEAPSVPERCLAAEIPRLRTEGTSRPMRLQGQDHAAVELVSRERLEGFREQPDETDKRLIARYLLNAALTEALHPLLHAVEVVLRNRIDRAAAARFPTDPARRTTYRDYPSWLDAAPGLLTDGHRAHVEDAKAKVFRDLRRRYGPQAAASARMLRPGRLVAALPFGFWVYLFDPVYSGSRDARGALWPEVLPAVFPARPGVSVGEVRRRRRHLLVVRNRVMHHERIHPYAGGRGLTWNLNRIRGEALELLGWMSPRASALVRDHDRLAEVSHPAFRRYLRWVPWRY